MALQIRTVTDVAGVAAALATPETSETITAPDERTLLVVVNGATASQVTLTVPGENVFGQDNGDVVIPIPAGASLFHKVGRRYRDPETGNATATFTNVSTVQAALVRFP